MQRGTIFLVAVWLCLETVSGVWVNQSLDDLMAVNVRFLSVLSLEGKTYHMDRYGDNYALEDPSRFKAQGLEADPGAYVYSDPEKLTYGWTNSISVRGMRFSYASVKLPRWEEARINVTVLADRVPVILNVEHKLVNATHCVVRDSLKFGEIKAAIEADGTDISEYLNAYDKNMYHEKSDRVVNCKNMFTPLRLFTILNNPKTFQKN